MTRPRAASNAGVSQKGASTLGGRSRWGIPLLTQTEQPISCLSFQGTELAEGATARRAKLTPR